MAKSLLFSCTLLISSALVFLIEFTCAKMVLPSLGGSPAVWNTCLVFFQAGLLLGYGYAHLAPSRLGVRRHALLHVALWLLAGGLLWALPLDPAAAGKPPGEPIFWLLRLLTLSVGFPFVLLSSCGPLVQRWFAGSVSARDTASNPLLALRARANPYFLYTASNLGSLLGLVLYPFVIEPNLTLAEQNQAWTWTYLILAGLLAACGCWLMWSGKAAKGISALPEAVKVKASSVPVGVPPLGGPRRPPKGGTPTKPPAKVPVVEKPWELRVRWVLLALAPSSLMLSVTSYLTTDIAPIPLMWMLPMALYLGSFVLVFSWHNTEVQAWMARWLPAVLLLVLIVPLAEGTEPILLVMAIHLLGFLWIALVCHGELARSKPAAEHLTEFYLWLAVGGVLGGMLNALVAPLLFNGIFEYPLVLVLTAWLNPGEQNLCENLPGKLEVPGTPLDLIVPFLVALLTVVLVTVVGQLLPADRLSASLMFFPPAIVCLLMAHQRVRFALCLGGLLLASGLYGGVNGHPILRMRSFFGVHRVTETVVDRDDGRVERFHVLVHGNTIHGMQSLDPERRNEPLTYFHRDGPIGKFFEALSKKNDPRLERVGVIGLGAGAMACYAAPKQHWTYFEIDPAVIRIANDRKLFTFLYDHKEQVDVILGDARLTLESRDETSPGGLGKPLAASDRFGVIVIDAFGSDSIPLHLLTREALAIYRQRLKPGGVIVFHISNRYFDLEPVLANLAAEIGWTCKKRAADENDKAKQMYASTWVFMVEKPGDLGDFTAPPARTDASLQPWTDDFSNVIQILKWGKDEG